MSKPNTITLKGDPVLKEGVAASAITPGHLIEFDADGDLQSHGTQDGLAQAMFAVELAAAGQAVSTDYAAGATVKYGVYRRGDEVYALLKDGQDVSKGDALASNGDGTLKAAPATPNDGVIVVYAAEDKAASGSDERIKVEVA